MNRKKHRVIYPIRAPPVLDFSLGKSKISEDKVMGKYKNPAHAGNQKLANDTGIFYNDGQGDNAVRNQFTAWMEIVVKNLKIDYIRRKSARNQIATCSQHHLSYGSYEQNFNLEPKGEFNFAEEKLSKAFNDLPLLRKRVLYLTFVEELTALEVAEQLNCSVTYVYDQKRRALQKLRKQLGTGGKDNEV